jgi:formylglycine-generating enzyme required for sulfatase activity
MDNQKTVFISYRRAQSRHWARSMFLDLKANGWDVFLDVDTIDSGDFDRIILNQIGARAHFILLISEGSMQRCTNEGDWLLREIEEAVRLQRNIVPIVDEGVDFDHEMSHLPPALRNDISKKNALPWNHFYFDSAMEKLRTRFLKSPEYIRIVAAPVTEQDEVQRRLLRVESEVPPKPTSLSLMPAPFEWVEIPGGRGTMRTNEEGVSLPVPTERYWMAKYPVTNAQYGVFIKNGGYETERWWPDEGWEWKSSINLKQPHFWHALDFDGSDQPVVCVSWYEAVAFCLWLSEVTDEAIMLPTEAQWQYAAQGKDGRAYPWGHQWHCAFCNNRVDPCGSNATTPVTQYKRIGDSPFGVTDMAGNVWEWCLTQHERVDQYSEINLRASRGCDFTATQSTGYRCDSRSFRQAIDRNVTGFRICRS